MKILKLLLITCLTASLTIQAQPTNGLVGFFPFSGNANDQSGNSYNGTVNGASLTTDRKGTSNNAYQFNGTSNYILYGSSFDYPERTVSIWFYCTQTSSSAISTVYSSDNKDLVNGMTAIYLKKINNVNKLIFNASDIIDTTDITLNAWHHAMLTVTSDSATMYLDGSSIGTKSISSQYHSMDVSTKATSGTTRALSNGFFEGKIDNLRVYNRVLNATELNELYVLGLKEVRRPGSVRVFPNPASDMLTIQPGGIPAAESHTIEISNSLSQVVYSTALTEQSLQINLSALGSKGLYFATLKDQSGHIIDIQKIILQ